MRFQPINNTNIKNELVESQQQHENHNHNFVSNKTRLELLGSNTTYDVWSGENKLSPFKLNSIKDMKSSAKCYLMTNLHLLT